MLYDTAPVRSNIVTENNESIQQLQQLQVQSIIVVNLLLLSTHEQALFRQKSINVRTVSLGLHVHSL